MPQLKGCTDQEGEEGGIGEFRESFYKDDDIPPVPPLPDLVGRGEEADVVAKLQGKRGKRDGFVV